MVIFIVRVYIALVYRTRVKYWVWAVGCWVEQLVLVAGDKVNYPDHTQSAPSSSDATLRRLPRHRVQRHRLAPPAQDGAPPLSPVSQSQMRQPVNRRKRAVTRNKASMALPDADSGSSTWQVTTPLIQYRTK